MSDHQACGSNAHFNRRTLLKAIGAGGISWLTPIAELLATPTEAVRPGRAQSLILLWLQGGPSQLETFDPHADTKIAAGTKSIKTAIKDVWFAEGMEQTADIADSLTIIRNAVSREGDHERAVYNIKTGFRPDPSLRHPAIGSVLCHQLANSNVEIPRHISILPSQWSARGGYLGNEFDAFRTGDPLQRQGDLDKRVSDERFDRRLDSLSVVDTAFANGRLGSLAEKTSHRTTIDRAVRMMSSEQLQAFDLKSLPKAEQDACGDTEFGRGCVAAARLVEVGVRCVEVTLSGWDTHANNHDFHTAKKKTLDPAIAGLIRYLKARSLFEETIVVVAGEFGRTPLVTPGTGGREHWPHGFSVVMAGGGLPAGHVLGETDPDGSPIKFSEGTPVEDIHATILHRMGIDYQRELETPVGRPAKICEGTAISELIS
ncbi:MAG: DUF1501 domain-containing protein [Planctomycetales bacterium]|nr:DUF1501 domain-containing protein [Planctomycetales bacterium]